jgi:hypothetical protein
VSLPARFAVKIIFTQPLKPTARGFNNSVKNKDQEIYWNVISAGTANFSDGTLTLS